MKKKFIAIILALLTAFSFTACSTGSFSKVSVSGRQDTDYTVYGNGGSTVQYGNYLYFINGYAGYENTDGKANDWGKITKGALYRAELYGEKGTNGNFTIKRDEVTGLELHSTAGTDYDENPINIVNVQLIAPKVIGTSDYKDGGIYIYDNFVYYATPNNEKNKQGEVQFKRTDFMRSRLDGGLTQKIYTTSTDTNSSPYMFYYQKGYTYLTVYEGSNITSVKMDSSKVYDVVTAATDVTSVIFPKKEIYYKGMDTNAPEDFVYLTRNVKDGDTQKAGNVIEVMRPDGTERFIFRANGTSDTLEAVRDGLFFFRTTYSKTETVMLYDNLHNGLTEWSPTYKAAQEKATVKNEWIKGTALNVSNIADYTVTFAFRYDLRSNAVQILAQSASGLTMFNNGKSTLVYSGTAKIKFVDYKNNVVYFTDSDEGTAYYRTNIFDAYADKAEEERKEQVVESSNLNGLNIDICAGYIIYIAKVDEWADNYTFFKKVDGFGGSEAIFVGKKIEADLKPEDDE